ncbi:AAA family ATPase [Paenibacillus macerans]|uniref:AAA family ATPase n=1 Tax=Paenibacillus macerans TaxID=44252 RepID=UPI002DBC6052|nr:AAA family ATPase [Paenibacillus macerans]MEC0140443.1 AAA family ATPase [Paenibacillus macerans]
MFIKGLGVKGFRGYKEHHSFQFGMINEIEGGNGRGKSSIMESISFGLAGVDKYGKERCADRLMNDKSNEMVITIEIEANGTTYEIERQVTRLKSKMETRILINRLQGSQDQIDQILGNRRRFLTSFLPQFLLTMSDKDMEAEFVSLIPLPRDEDVFAALAEENPDAAEILKGVSLTDPKVFISKESDELKQSKEELIRLEGKEEEIKTALTVDIPDLIPIDTTEIDGLKQAIKSIEALKPTPTEISELQNERQALLGEYKALQAGLKFEEDHFITCENCGHEIDLNAEQAKKNEEITAKLVEIQDKGKQIAAEIENIQASDRKAAEEFHTANESSLAELRAELERLEANFKVTQQHNMRVEMLRDNQKAARERQNSVRKEKIELAEAIEKTEARIKAAKAFNITRCEMQMKDIKKHLNRASIRLFEVVRSTGEVKPAFKAEFDGKPLRVLSTSEEVLCFLEFSQLFRTFSKTNYPVFVDWAESIEEIPDQHTQTFIARMVPKKPLEVKEGAVIA